MVDNTMKMAINLSTICFSIGLALTTAPQLRFGSLPIGFGEVILSMWILFTAISLIKNDRMIVYPLAKKFSIFWFGMFFFLLLGSLIGLYLGSWSTNFYHDTLSFLFIAVLFIVFLLKPDFNKQIHTIISLTLSFIIVPLLLLLIFGQFSPYVGSIQLWFDEVRFLGWAANPNQIAFTVCALPFLSIYMSLKHNHSILKIWHILLAAASIWIGFSTKSDTLQAAWTVGGALLLILLWYRSFSIAKTGYWMGVFAKIILPVMILSVIFIFGKPIQSEIKDNITSIFGEDDQGEIRLTLWTRGVEATAASPLFGHGPGPHSGIEAPFEEKESHNTFIDVSTMNGIFGLLIYLGFIIWIAWKAWIQKQNFILIGLMTILMFSTFHLILRYPLYWFYLVTIMTICQRSSEKEKTYAIQQE